LSLHSFLTQTLACSYGSIMRGHLEVLVLKIPLSIETVSEGRLAMFHSLI
jgi:hypothetical protein